MQQQSFFERLPYDVRAIIYGYLEPDDLPPLTRGFLPSTSGFLLSCRRAKQDLDDVATINLSRHLAKFKKTFETSTDLKVRFPAHFGTTATPPLRHIAVTLPFTSFHSFHPNPQNALWKREVLVGLHSLFSNYVDTLLIHFSGADGQPSHETLLDRGRVEVGMHNLLRGILYMVERVNRDQTGRIDNIVRQPSVTAIFRYQPGQSAEVYPSAKVNARRICLSWDLREGEPNDGKMSDILNGKIHRHQESATRVDNAGTETPIFYHLRDEQRLVGEMGIVSSSRWGLTDYTRANSLLSCINTHVSYCSNEGLGKALKEGLNGVEESDFEECEEEIGRLVFA